MSSPSGRMPVGLTLDELKRESALDASQPVDRSSSKCAACGKHHNSPGQTHERAELDCLRRTVRQQREQIAGLKLEIQTLKDQIQSRSSVWTSPYAAK